MPPFSEIRKVAPAEIVTLDDRGTARRRYWRWPIGASAGPPTLDTFDGVFREAVRRQSDAEVECGLGDANSSALFTLPERSDFKYVVMPMRI